MELLEKNMISSKFRSV